MRRATLTVFRHADPATRLRDLANRQRFGPAAPLVAQRIDVAPAALSHVVAPGPRAPKRRHSGRIMDGTWDRDARDLSTCSKVEMVRRRFREGLSWEETGMVAHMMDLIKARGRVDGCTDLDSVMRRLARIDALYDEVRQTGRLEARGALYFGNFRESRGIFVHVGRAGRLVFGGAGNHRLGVALAARLPTIPCQLGAVHPGAMADGSFARLARATP